ncbi:hypothetical protein V8B97DRAFT_1921046 [Scleroderma yunnanense]
MADFQFIQNSVPPQLHAQVKIGHGLQSETSTVQQVCWVTEDGTSITLVDTPGFDDSRAALSDVKVLKMIARFLTKENKAQQVTGLIYVHRISETRMAGSLQRNLRMFQKLCGPVSLKNVVIVTTMWDTVTSEEGQQHEQELRSSETMFKPLLDGGATMLRHDRTPRSATNVIDRLLGKDPTTTQIVHELVQELKELKNTAAGTELRSDIDAYLQRLQNETKSLEAEMREMSQSEIAEERQRLDRVVARLSRELEELKRGFAKPIEKAAPERENQETSDPPSYESTNNFPAPETKCIVHYTKFLRLIKASQATIAPVYPQLSSLAVSRATQLADAVEESVKGVQRGLSILRSVLASENVHTLQQFMKADPQPRAFTQGMWKKAQTDMEIVSNDIGGILSTSSKPVTKWFWNGNAVKRFEVSNRILEAMKEVVADAATMVDWWTPVINTLRNVEDATHRTGRGVGFDDAVRAALARIIRALDSYSVAYERCAEDIRKAASGLR